MTGVTWTKRCAMTLLEVIVVALIIGSLAAIIVPRYVDTTVNAAAEVSAVQISQLNTLVDRFFLDEGNFPDTLDDLVPNYIPDGVPPHPNPNMSYTYDSSRGIVSEVAR